MSSYNYDVDALRQICPIFVETEESKQAQRSPSVTYNVSEYEAGLLKARDDYIAKVEQGNLYIDKLLALEEKYFKQKYGEGIYEYMLQKRNDFINNKNIEECKSGAAFGDSPFIEDPANDIGYLVENLKNDLINEYDLYNTLKNNNYEQISKKVTQNNKELNENILDLYGQTSVNQRKIEYRHDEIMKITSMNNMVTLVYYFLFIVMMMYFAYKKQLNLGKKWLIYLLVIIFPIFIYPFMFYYLKKLFVYLSNNMEIHGPKNAFMNQKLDMNFIDKHDI